MSWYSFHPIEAIMYMFVLWILFLFDLNLYAFLFAIFMTDFITTLWHTGKEIFGEKYKKSIWFAIFTNSAHHFSHHYQNNGNLAWYFTYLDKLFWTYNKDYEHLFDKK
jgi:sterol desaturase/sphingolipid hydroxylase (fatty acid hydroxylase superfamily)